MVEPSVETRLENLNKAVDNVKKLVEANQSTWTSGCELAFSQFRMRVVHLRREPAALDSVEDKDQVWQFIVKFCKAVPFHHDRCNEVLRILMKSDAWMEKFNDDDSLQIGDLPEGIADEFDKRAQEVREKPRPGEDGPEKPQPKAGYPQPKAQQKPLGQQRPRTPWDEKPVSPPVSTPMRPANMAVVVQRFTKARVLIDEKNDWWGEVGAGIMISVSFTRGAKDDAVGYAARFLLTAKLSTRDIWAPGQQGTNASFGSDAESVVTICKDGGEQGVVVMPQASIVADLEKDNVGLKYGAVCEQKEAEKLYKTFIDALREASSDLVGTEPPARPPQIVNTPFHGRQYCESTTAQPFLHAFNF